MEDSIGYRLQQIIDDKMLSGARFAKEIGVSSQLLNAYLRNDRNPSSKVLKLISVRFPEINTRWLLTGEGNMMKNKQPSIFPDWEIVSDENSKDSNIISRLLTIIERQQEENERLSDSISKIKSMLEDKFDL
ncbi:MAG: helix-turn-helix transcriptional regulator [Dysgonomonas mossii]|uniref:helix-turn-helix domain-containing protein n=1 Tax=Dysgonomonas mossii TaxID=163665 RepID=UPI001DC659D6|nr:helix-turn-helix transcriptional regulator [Dysgonomonas mossii]MBS5797360.1 helix-turn-helix transcriptional regulator [Dysgonomonas mossii]MBS7110754.1 helix-turn-helix transcriptional regulator [Dysgonomonas mossii]